MKMQKKEFVLWAFIFLSGLFPAGDLMAMPSDADSNTAQMSGKFTDLPIAIGVSGDFVTDRGLDQNERLNTVDWYGANIYFDPAEKLHLDLFLGAASGDLEDLRIVLNTGVPVVGEFGAGTSDTAFAYGLTAKVDVAEFSLIQDQPKTELFASGGYRSTNPDLTDAISSAGRRPTVLNMSVELQEWQVGSGVKQRFENLIEGVALAPYIGVKYSDMNVDLSGSSSFPVATGTTASIVTGERESDENVGLFLGFQILGLENRFSFDFEGRLIDETALYVNGHLRW